MRNFNYENLDSIKWDTQLANLVAQIHESKGRQELYIRQKPAELARLVDIAKVQSTEASNKIEGIVTTNTRIKALVKEKTTPKNRDEEEIVGYRNVLNIIHNSHEDIPVKSRYILQLHRYLLKETGKTYAGKYKATQNYINAKKPDGAEITLFEPLPPFEVEQAINNICHSYQTVIAKEQIDPLILIPCFILDFLCIHPFTDGNGRMSRLLTLLLLYKSGYEVGKYISVEKKIEETKDIYYERLAMSNKKWHSGKNDPIPFIKYMLEIILACYKDFESRTTDVEKSTKSTAYDIVKAYVDSRIGRFSGSDVVANCPQYGRASILNAVGKLVDEKYIIKHGGGRNTYYTKNTEED